MKKVKRAFKTFIVVIMKMRRDEAIQKAKSAYCHWGI